jgi:hypothetical protein
MTPSAAAESLTIAFLRQDESLEEVEPRFVSGLVDVEVEVDAQKKLAFHVVDLGKVNPRDFGPSLVGVRVAKER